MGYSLNDVIHERADKLSVRWTRVWTIQEFLLPKRLDFYCGSQSISRSSWRRAITNIYNYSAERPSFFASHIDQKAFTDQWARGRLLAWCRYKRSAIGLIALMAYTGHHKATDDRDRVYALLGICSDTDRAIVGAPDYTCSVEELYTRLVVDFTRHHQSLNILCHRALFTAPRPDTEDPGRGRLPTWVPDWRRWTYAASRPVPSMVSEPSRPEIGNFYSITDKEHGVADPNLVYAASAGLPAEFSVSQDSRRLTCKGIVIGIVDGLGPVALRGPEGGLDGYSSQTLIQSTSDANTMRRGHGPDPDQQQPAVRSAASYAVLESLVRCLSLDRAGRYLMQPADVDGYVGELCDALLGPMSEGSQDGVGRFIEANKELSVQQASLSEHLRMANTLPRGSETRGEHSFWQASEMTVGDRPWDCRVITTDQGHLGMAPRQAMKGDVVAVLIGCSVPVILRGSAGVEEYEVVGEAFVPEYMKGEAIETDKTPIHITLV